MSTEKRFDLVISGKVQGVGYRYFVKHKADSLGISGFVRNQNDGSVFVAAQGTKPEMEHFVRWCYQGPPTALIKTIENIPGTIEDFRNFSILY